MVWLDVVFCFSESFGVPELPPDVDGDHILITFQQTLPGGRGRAHEAVMIDYPRSRVVRQYSPRRPPSVFDCPSNRVSQTTCHLVYRFPPW
ncbi:hypothetical protein ILYODFUR_016777 [Ilyodon furcidens]|uniref:Secreted protein n=1 Tax=Ilyodon furcidens TaxID=33524 RepID=A0ABV0TY43_9TELE